MATTSTALTATPAASRSHRPRGALAQAARVFARDRPAMLGLLIIAIIGGAALAAPLISPWDPLTSASVERLSPVQRKPARPALGMNDVKTRLAEILADHIGKTGIVFDQEDAFAHGSSSHDVAVNRDASAPTTAC